VGAVTFIELPTERFFGFDPTTNPRWLTLPTGEDRHVGFTAAPATAAPAFVSLNPAIATVTSTADQLEVHGVADGATEIEAREGAARVGRLRVEVKDERRRSTAFHFVRDSAVPPHRATAAPTAATMLDLLNRVWQRQANVLYTLAATRNIVMPGDLGVAVDDDGFGGGEMGLVTAQGAAAQYRVFRVWDVRLAGAAVNGGLNNGANTLVANAPCGDGWGLPHEAGHALGLGHGDGGVMRPCGIRVNQRVLHAAADRVNP
jgi:hypothetical protein